MKIGGVISSIEFSNDEKDRISNALISGSGLIYDVITKKAHSVEIKDFWHRAQKRYRVNGFRVGHHTARSMVVKKAIESLRTRPGYTNEDIWPLYRVCAKQYVHDDLLNLNKILRNEEFEISDGSLTEQIFRSIKEKLPLFSVDVKEVEILYEIWGFDRISNFKEIILNDSLTTKAASRLISLEIEKARREIIPGINQLTAQLECEKEERSNQLLSIREEMTKIENKIDLMASTLKTELQYYLSNLLETKNINLEENTIKIGKEVSELSEKKILFNAERVNALQTQVDEITNKIKAHEELIKQKIIFENIESDKPNEEKQQISPEIIFKECQSILSKNGIASPAMWKAFVLMNILKNSRVIITERPSLILSYISCVLNMESITITASPLWISSLDWKNEFDFINDGNKYRILVIQDFDVALQESYLVPALVNWTSNNKLNAYSRIVLVPSKPLLSAVSNRILEMSSFLDFDGRWLRQEIKDSNKMNAEFDFSNPIKAYDIIGFSLQSDIELEVQLKQYSLKSGIAMPMRLVTNFINVFKSLSLYLIDSDAAAIALDVTILPWVNSIKGVSSTRIASESLRFMFSGE